MTCADNGDCVLIMPQSVHTVPTTMLMGPVKEQEKCTQRNSQMQLYGGLIYKPQRKEAVAGYTDRLYAFLKD